jgi:uncharacterized protein (TIGR02594 family)
VLRRLASNLKEAIAPAPIPPWIQLMKREIGVKEVRGGENPEILKYFKATTLKATEDEVPWCSAIVNWIMRECNMERSYSAAARSWLGHGKRLGYFKKYSIVVMRRGNSSWQGHVGFAMEDLGTHIRVLGGNQSDSVCYANYKKSSVIDYVWPTPETTALELS